jgi:hypothetical protein
MTRCMQQVQKYEWRGEKTTILNNSSKNILLLFLILVKIFQSFHQGYRQNTEFYRLCLFWLRGLKNHHNIMKSMVSFDLRVSDILSKYSSHFF